LEARLAEAEDTLRAIRNGEVDALMVARPEGDQVYTLQGAETTYRLLVEEMNEGALLLSPEGTVLYSNARFAALANVALERVTGSRWERFFVPADHGRLQGLLAAAGAGDAREDLDLDGQGGPPRPVAVSLRAMRGDRPQGFSVVVADLTGQKAAEAALREANEALELRVAERTAQLTRTNELLLAEMAERERTDEELRRQRASLRQSEARYRDLAESVPAMVWAADARGVTVNHTSRWYEYTGQTAEQACGEGWREVVHPDDAQRVGDRWGQSLRTGEDYAIEYRIRRAIDGAYRWHSVRATLRKDEGGAPQGWFGICIDIEERRQTEERFQVSLREKEVLLKEVHHRVKNNLQVIASLVDLQADALQEPALRGVFAEMRDRVRSMALVHEKLYQSENLARVEFADYTRSLLTYLARAHRSAETRVRLELKLEPVSLAVGAAVPCGLLLSELVTNAFKHGFRGRSEGKLAAGLRQDADGRVRLRVSDDGVGLPADVDWRQSRSLGLRLVHLLSRQLDAAVEVRQGGGTDFLITFKPPPLGDSGETQHG